MSLYFNHIWFLLEQIAYKMSIWKPTATRAFSEAKIPASDTLAIPSNTSLLYESRCQTSTKSGTLFKQNK